MGYPHTLKQTENLDWVFVTRNFLPNTVLETWLELLQASNSLSKKPQTDSLSQ